MSEVNTTTERDVREAKRALHDCNKILNDHDDWCSANNKLQVEMVAQALAARTSGAVEVTRGKSTGFDEMYGEWFACGNCKDNDLADGWVYCPQCGAKNVNSLKTP